MKRWMDRLVEMTACPETRRSLNTMAMAFIWACVMSAILNSGALKPVLLWVGPLLICDCGGCD